MKQEIQNMYNQQIKEEFINYYCSTIKANINTIKGIFANSKKIEEKLSKDLCCFDKDDILILFSSYKTGWDTLNTLRSLFISYTYFCFKKGYIKKINMAYDNLTPDELHKCIDLETLSNKIITKEKLYECINKLENPCDKFVLEAIYTGIRGHRTKELKNIKLKDINTNDNTIKIYTGETIKCSNTLIRNAIFSINEYSYISLSKNTVMPLWGDTVIKNLNQVRKDTDEAWQKRIDLKISTLSKYLNVYFTTKSLYDSGYINCINERAKIHNQTGIEYLLNNKEDYEKYVLRNYRTKRVVSSVIRKYGEFLK